jgi:hypothetical protein
MKWYDQWTSHFIKEKKIFKVGCAWTYLKEQNSMVTKINETPEFNPQGDG